MKKNYIKKDNFKKDNFKKSQEFFNKYKKNFFYSKKKVYTNFGTNFFSKIPTHYKLRNKKLFLYNKYTYKKLIKYLSNLPNFKIFEIFYKLNILKKKKMRNITFIQIPSVLNHLFINRMDYLNFDLIFKNLSKKNLKYINLLIQTPNQNLLKLNLFSSNKFLQYIYFKNNLKIFKHNPKLLQLFLQQCLRTNYSKIAQKKYWEMKFFNKKNKIFLNSFFDKTRTINIFKSLVFTPFLKKIFKKKFYMKFFKKKYFYKKNIWRINKPKHILLSNLKKMLKNPYKAPYLKSFSLYNKSMIFYRKAPHYKEVLKLKFRILYKLPFEKRVSYIRNRIILAKNWWRRKFLFKVLKTRRILINKKVTKFSYFFPWLKRYTTRFMINRFKYSIRNNRKIFWKKNWKKTKLNKKQYFSKRFLIRNLSRGNFRRQDSFRLLHNFRTIFLKYIYKYSSKNLSYFFKKLKNHSFIENFGTNFIERFLWQLERSINILMFRGKYIPNIKISNHLVRYGFVMLNNTIINNPYFQSNVLDTLRICKLKYFKRIFLTQFINLYGIRRRQSIVSFIETNKKILALSVYRKPKVKDFIKKKINVVFSPDKYFYSAVPIISALF